MAQATTTISSKGLAEVWDADDDWTSIHEKEQRKKRQNRLNQRAYRKRNNQELSDKSERPFRVERFRLPSNIAPSQNEVAKARGLERSPLVVQTRSNRHAHPSSLLGPNWTQRQPDLDAFSQIGVRPVLVNQAEEDIHQTSETFIQPTTSFENNPVMLNDYSNLVSSQMETRVSQHLDARSLGPSPFKRAYLTYFTSAYTQGSSSLPPPDADLTYFPLSSDHLLHLIHYNLFRALVTNKVLLDKTTILIRHDCGQVSPSFTDLCDGLTVVEIKSGQIVPPTLVPTITQMTVGHQSWLNMFPHRQLRDNLIQHEALIDHFDFCNDIFGEAIGHRNGSSSGESTGLWSELDDEITGNRKGLIVWGECWDPEAYEITPGFLKKWSWLLKGCEDLIVSSNVWRAKRNEEPLVWDSSSVSQASNFGSSATYQYGYFDRG